MVSGVAGAAGPAATGVNAFVQVVLDDLAQEVADFVFGCKRGNGCARAGFVGGRCHGLILEEGRIIKAKGFIK
jgi:hypothetical protein